MEAWIICCCMLGLCVLGRALRYLGQGLGALMCHAGV